MPGVLTLGPGYIVLLSERSPAPLRYATKEVRMISGLLIMVQDSIYREPGLIF
jgi:hypothetical protein